MLPFLGLCSQPWNWYVFAHRPLFTWICKVISFRVCSLPFSPLIPRDCSCWLPLQGRWQPNLASGLQKKGWALPAHLLREPVVSEQSLQMDALQSVHVGTLLNPRESLSLVLGGGNNISTSGAVLEQNSLNEQSESHENAHELWDEEAGYHHCCSFVTEFCSLALSKATGQPPVKEDSEEPRSWIKSTK